MLIALGGLAILMRGLGILSQSLGVLIGGPVRRVFTWATANAWRAWLAGVLVGAGTLNSSALSLTAIGLAEAGVARFAPALVMGLAAKAGATLALVLTVTPLGRLALPIIGVGFLISLVRRVRIVGEVVIGLGLLLLGVSLMVQGLLPLTDSELFQLIERSLEASPLGLWLLGFALAAVLGSANAVAAIALALASSQALSMQASLALLLGGGAGSGVLLVLASWRNTPISGRIAFSHVAFKMLVSLPLLVFLPGFAWVCTQLTIPALGAGGTVVQAHLIYHTLASVLVLGLLGLIERLALRLVPDDDQEIRTKYIDVNALESRELSSSLALREVSRIGDQLSEMLTETVRILSSGQGNLEAVAEREEKVDQLARAVVLYLSEVAVRHPGESPLMLMVAASELEHMGDQVRRILRVQNKLAAQHLEFSASGRAELADAAVRVLKRLQLALAALATRDARLGEQVMMAREDIEHHLLELRRSHLGRLGHGEIASRATTLAHLDLLIVLDELDQSLTRLCAISQDLDDQSRVVHPVRSGVN